MKIRLIFVSALIAVSTLSATSNTAFAFCGVIQESATARNAEKASHRARDAVHRKLKKLRNQYGYKLQVEEPSLACLGGAVAIDANGNQLIGKPSCTATVSFCVNP